MKSGRSLYAYTVGVREDVEGGCSGMVVEEGGSIGGRVSGGGRVSEGRGVNSLELKVVCVHVQ